MDGFLERLPELVIVVGKGGVGKTTCAIGVASALAASGQPTLLVSTDPAGSLGPVLGTTLAGGVARRIEAVPGLAAMQLEPAVTRKEFLARWRSRVACDPAYNLNLASGWRTFDLAFPPRSNEAVRTVVSSVPEIEIAEVAEVDRHADAFEVVRRVVLLALLRIGAERVGRGAHARNRIRCHIAR